MKKAVIMNTINPSTGDVFIKGQKGNAKSTAVIELKNQALSCILK